ncbi:DUF6882 domain-containing protein [Propionibacteriaceae bacterium G1746]|uniref:DUF6882 domain-containing protein n=1 Tax=Aestuariimicrobium sp. G57 TaxID=3418485 RepID=UPI003C2A50CD
MALTYENVLDDSILLHLENHLAFADFIDAQTGGGSDQAKVDLDRRQITFLPRLVKRNEVVVPMHIAAVVQADPAVARWAWAMPEYAEKPISILSSRVRDFGTGQGIAQLAEAEHPVPDGQVATHPLALAAVACRITGMPTAHLVPAGTAQVVLLLDPAGFMPPAPTVASVTALVGNATGTGLVSDARRAVQGYAQGRGISYQWGEGFGSLQLAVQDGTVTVAFGEDGAPQVVG